MATGPRTARGRATRERILTAATELVATSGVAATSLDDVCRRAECSKSQLYLYFHDREDLLRAVAQDTTEQVMRSQANALAACGTLAGMRDYLDGIVALQIACGARGGCPIGSLAGQLAETDEDARSELADGMARWRESLAQGIRAMLADGQLAPAVEPTVMATQILALIQGGLLLTQIHRDPDQVQIAVNAALNLVAGARTSA